MNIVDVRLWHHAHVVAVGGGSRIVGLVSISVLGASRLRVGVASPKDCAIILSHLLINLAFGLLKGLDIASR